VEQKVTHESDGWHESGRVDKHVYEKPRLEQLGTLQELTKQYSGSTPELP